jgi:glycosyltransferase involved in cell wall biosynthesis
MAKVLQAEVMKMQANQPGNESATAISRFERINEGDSMAKAIVTIIIPVHNTADYLRRCLDSVIQQSLTDIEIIVVDDASTDHSLAIIAEYAQRDRRIKLIAFDCNRGPGAARNTGINAATGTYLMFVDSDDWLEFNAAEAAHAKASEQQYDLVLFGYRWHFVWNQASQKIGRVGPARLPRVEGDDPHFFRYLMQHRKGLSCQAWQFMYLADTLKRRSIEFPEGIYFEDIIFVTKIVYHSQKIGILKMPLYNYRYRANSITQSTSKKKIRDLQYSLALVKAFLEEQGIMDEFNKEYLLRYLQQAVCGAFYDYMKLSKQESDAALDEHMASLRKGETLGDENLALIKNEIATLGADEQELKDAYIKLHATLLSLRENYYWFRWRFKIIYHVIVFWLSIPGLLQQAKRMFGLPRAAALPAS